MKHTFRTASLADADWILDTAREAYGPERITAEASEWVRQHLPLPSIRCFLGERSFAFVQTYRPFWEPKPIAWLMFFGARPGRDWESIALVRTVAAYAKSQGCASLHAGNTDDASNISVLLRRIGARPYELYELRL